MPKQKRISIEGLLEGYEAALTQTGYSITTKLLLVKTNGTYDPATSERRLGIF